MKVMNDSAPSSAHRPAAGCPTQSAARLGLGRILASGFALPFIHFIPDSLTYSVPLFLKRQCDQTPGTLWFAPHAAHTSVYAPFPCGMDGPGLPGAVKRAQRFPQ
jgi:hypothetical protein